MNKSNNMLKRNYILYNYFLKYKIMKARNSLAHEETLRRIVFISKFTWRNHSGYYSDGRIENILIEYGINLEKYIDEQKLKSDMADVVKIEKKCSVLHIATELYAAGGHTRMLYQFVKRCEGVKHVLVLTDQNIDEIPVLFKTNIESNLTIISLKYIKSPFNRAYVLRYISEFCEKVILHHHPYDVVPIMAFSRDKGPPVILDNHSHSWFWLGASVADLVYSYSEFHRDFALKKRPVSNAYFLRCTDADDIDTEFIWDDKGSFKLKLGLDPNAFCVITVGTPEKFIPNANYDFLKTAERILIKFSNVEIYVIGVSDSTKISKEYKHNYKKIHFLGTIVDLKDYYKAADVYLEALPQPSGGVTIASTPIGLCCPLLKYGTSLIFNNHSLLESKLYDKYVGYLKNEDEYLDKFGFIMNNPEIRRHIAEEIRHNYVKRYSKESICESFKRLLDITDDIGHLVSKIPSGTYYSDADSVEIAYNSELQDIDSVMNYFKVYLNKKDIIIVIVAFSINFVNLAENIKYLLSRIMCKLNSFLVKV